MTVPVRPRRTGGSDAPGSAGAGGGSGEAEDSEDTEDPDAEGSGDQGDSGHKESFDQQDDPDRPDDSSQGGTGDDAESEAQESHDPAGTGEILDSFQRQDQPASPPAGPATQERRKNAEETQWDEAMHQAPNLAKAEGKGPVRETVKQAHASAVD